MIDLSWTIEQDPEGDLTESPRPLLSTWHYLRSSLRRRWRTVAALSTLGALLGLGIVVLMPPGSTATVTLLMAHPSSMDGPEGSAMDVSLLATREVADRTVTSLGLALTPEAFRSTVTAEPVTTEVLTVTVSGPDDAAAVTRGKELVSQYLAFRDTQLESLSSGTRSQYATRIASAQKQVTELTRQFERLSARGTESAGQAFDVLARRSDLSKKIADWQETLDNATLQTEAALASTHVIDPVHANRSSTKRAMVLAAGSGLVVGGALAVGIVLFRALVSERLRQRKDVGIALRAPVRFSVRSKGPRDHGSRLERLRPQRVRWGGDDLTTLALGLERALEPQAGAPGPGGPDSTAASTAATNVGNSAAEASANGRRHSIVATKAARASALSLESGLRDAAATVAEADPPSRGGKPVERTPDVGEGRSSTNGASAMALRPGRRPAPGVALAAIGNPSAAADVVAAAATRLREGGATVILVDLSSKGSLAARAGEGAGVLRPTGTPRLARGPRVGTDAVVDLPEGAWRQDWDSADLVLALVEVDPGIEVHHIVTWVDRVVPLVTAGANTAELLSTTGDLVREAGLELPFVMMVGCDATDESLGIVAPVNVVDRVAPVDREAAEGSTR